MWAGLEMLLAARRTRKRNLRLLNNKNGFIVLGRSGPVVLKSAGLVGLDPLGGVLADFLELFKQKRNMNISTRTKDNGKLSELEISSVIRSFARTWRRRELSMHHSCCGLEC